MKMRLKWMAARPLVFLGLNGYVLDRDDQRLDDAVLDVATGTMTREVAAQILRAVAGII